ncbi:metallophosphoesterase [Paenibacillus lautus]
MSVLMWIAGAAALGAGAIGWMRVEARGYRLREEEVVSERIPRSFDGFRMLFITDIHRRQLSEEKLLSNISSVDCVLLGGDITEKGVPLERLRHNMSVLARIAPVYAVLGNHDLYAGKDAVRKVLRESGVILMNDKTVTLKRDDECLVLSGVRQPASRKHPYTKFRGNAAEDQYHIILVHDPIWLKGKEETHGDLLLAGHTHGGQIVLPIAGAVRLERFYKKYKSGWYTLPRKAGESVQSSRLLISRGFGTSHIPLRLKCPAEYHVITLRKKP